MESTGNALHHARYERCCVAWEKRRSRHPETEMPVKAPLRAGVLELAGVEVVQH